MLMEKIDSRRTSFADLLREIESRRDDIDRGRHVPRDIVDMMKQAGIFRAATPRLFGGDALPPAEFLRLVEAIGAVDGSAAWVAAFGSANTYLAALPIDTQRIIYAQGPDQVFAGGLYPLQPADPAPGGWRVSGRWRFASGCMGSDWIGVGIQIAAPDGVGKPLMRIAVAPASEIEIIDDWEVVGLQGTGSFSTRVENKFYAADWTCARGGASQVDEPLYRYSLTVYQAQVHAAVNIGLGRAALDLVASTAGAIKIMPNAPSLCDRAYFRIELARGEAMWRSARAFFYEAAEQAWDEIMRGDTPTRDTNSLLRLSATNAAHACADVVRLAYRIAGMTAAHKTNRLQQIVRDSMVVTQHASLSEATLEMAGAVLAGRDPGQAFP